MMAWAQEKVVIAALDGAQKSLDRHIDFPGDLRSIVVNVAWLDADGQPVAVSSEIPVSGDPDLDKTLATCLLESAEEAEEAL